MKKRDAARSAWTIAIAVTALLVFCVASCAVGMGLLTWAVRRPGADPGEGRQAIEDESLRFRLRRPGHDWRLLEPEEAARLNSDASAMAVHTQNGSFGVVIVEPAYGADLERAADTLRTAYVSIGTELGPWETARVDDRPALRATGSGTTSGVAMHVSVAVLVHQDHIYQLACFMLAHHEGDPPLDPVIEAFALLEGPVVFDPPVVSTADGEGPLWRVRGDVLESAVGLRARGGDGWGVLAGSELVRVSETAHVGIARAVPSITITVTAQSLHGADPALVRARLREQAATDMGADLASLSPPEDRLVAGRSVPFVTFRVQDGMGIDYAHGVVADGARFFEILAFSPAPGALAAHLDEGLARIELTTDRDQRALEQATSHASSDAVADGLALRAGTFRAYDHALRWRSPGPCWHGLVGEEASSRDPGTSTLLECPRLGITAALWIEALDEAPSDAAVEHAWAVSELFSGPAPDDPSEPTTPHDPPEEASFGTVTGLASRGEYVVDGGDFAYRLFTMARGGTSIRWAVWYARTGDAEVEREAGAAFEAMGVDADAPPELTFEPGFYEDRRLGVAFEDRASGLRFVEERTWNAAGGMVKASGRGTTVLVFAIHTSGVDSSAVAINSVRDRLLAEQRSSFLFGRPEETAGTLGGEPCRVIRWTEGGRRNAMRLAQHGGVVAGLITESSAFGDDDQRWVDAFRFVDP